MKKKKMVLRVLIIIINIVLIALTDEFIQIDKYSKNYYYLMITSSILFITLGFFINNKSILTLDRGITVDFKLLSLGIVLSIIGAIPVMLWYLLLGHGMVTHDVTVINLFKSILHSIYANHAINVVAGATIASSLEYKNESGSS